MTFVLDWPFFWFVYLFFAYRVQELQHSRRWYSRVLHGLQGPHACTIAIYDR